MIITKCRCLTCKDTTGVDWISFKDGLHENNQMEFFRLARVRPEAKAAQRKHYAGRIEEQELCANTSLIGEVWVLRFFYWIKTHIKKHRFRIYKRSNYNFLMNLSSLVVCHNVSGNNAYNQCILLHKSRIHCVVAERARCIEHLFEHATSITTSRLIYPQHRNSVSHLFP